MTARRPVTRGSVAALLALALAAGAGCADRGDPTSARLDRIETRLERLDERLTRTESRVSDRSAPAAADDQAGGADGPHGTLRSLERMDPARRARLEQRVARMREAAQDLAARTGTTPGSPEFQREMMRELARRLRERHAAAAAPPEASPAPPPAAGNE